MTSSRHLAPHSDTSHTYTHTATHNVQMLVSSTLQPSTSLWRAGLTHTPPRGVPVHLGMPTALCVCAQLYMEELEVTDCGGWVCVSLPWSSSEWEGKGLVEEGLSPCCSILHTGSYSWWRVGGWVFFTVGRDTHYAKSYCSTCNGWSIRIRLYFSYI